MIDPDEEMVEMIRADVRAEERTAMVARIRAAAAAAVPRETKDYLDGVEEGVRLICEAVLRDA